MLSKKDEIQIKFISELCRSFSGINLISVRTGKCRIYLSSIKKLGLVNPKVLVIYPNIDIKNSWVRECELIDYYPDITYCTYISIDKVLNTDWDVIVCDEAHLIPKDIVLPKLGEFVKRHKNVILASGTYSNETLQALKDYTGLDLTINYPTEQAIKDGIVCDFKIIIHQYNLDATTVKEFGKVKKWKSTDLKESNRLTHKVNNSYGQEKFFNALNRMRFINSCDSLVNFVKSWIKENNKRFILFTGSEEVGKKYNLPMYNSKSKTDDVLIAFQNEEINQLCLIKKGKAGVTYPKLDTILLTAIDSNPENTEQALGRSLLTDTDNAEIYIFVSSEQYQLKWLNSALESINKEKIIWK